ncbi:MAG: biotin--[acetyl-CoA-carboxylase] ligase [Nitrospinota bacterium]
MNRKIGFNKDIFKSNLKSSRLGHNLELFDQLDSTNEYLLEKGRNGIADLAVVAESQTAGRGRRGRSWESIRYRSLTFSFSYFVSPKKINLENIGILSLATAVAIAQSLSSLAMANHQTEIGLKYPNDILINNKKVGGILSELISFSNKKIVVTGIGLNFSANPMKNSKVTGVLSDIFELNKVSRESFLSTFFLKMENIFKLLDDGKKESIIVSYKKFDKTRGMKLIVQNGARKFIGVAVDIDKDGMLLIKKSDGELVKHNSGDITFCMKSEKL